ncbi:NADPH:quinone reductase-like Zn-dependent oxidoreductase [Kribbella sp. VKM Ac-2571]|uniref:NADP-dependent oxidoreductase n=1 Tax=Kribbella sp. VKM Ac-2571 TaxID=2512222 RepID=UPI001061A9A2|nr:NADP-dependent oxidoreductase [Kribbella sp. VKM Ac-2571]TDO64042.1 NADPH:quinone reductase-like Zn-dependent oxidoreductase [Kribbella sp. VKM Ac-2571]
MRALVARRLDGPEAIELIETAAPEPAAGQIRIKVAAAAINPVDLAVTTGALVEFGLTAARQQFGLGWDVAGTVDAVGPTQNGGRGETTRGGRLHIGDAAVGVADLLGRDLKTHAEYVVLDADTVVPAPHRLSLVESATFGLNGLTALQAIKALEPEPGQTLLVTGAAGGVGGYAVEIAKYLGLTVIAAASAHDEELVRLMGAEHFVDRSQDLATAVRRIAPAGVDALVDAAVVGVGAQEAVRNGGRHVHVQGGPCPPHLRGISVEQILVQANRSDLEELVRLVDAGALSTRVADVHPLTEAAAAYKRVAAGGVRGRLVLVP